MMVDQNVEKKHHTLKVSITTRRSRLPALIKNVLFLMFFLYFAGVVLFFSCVLFFPVSFTALGLSIGYTAYVSICNVLSSFNDWLFELEDSLAEEKHKAPIKRKKSMDEFFENYYTGKTGPEVEMLKQGYEVLEKAHNFQHVQEVHCDHYAALRAVLYQALVAKSDLKKVIGSMSDIQGKINEYELRTCDYGFKYWELPEEIRNRKQSLVKNMENCLRKLVNLVRQESYENLHRIMKGKRKEDMMMLEGVKALLLIRYIHLYNLDNNQTIDDHPAKDLWMKIKEDETSSTPLLFFKNYLQPLGIKMDISPLHFPLLAFCFGVTVDIYRVHKHQDEDCIVSHYKEKATPPSRATVSLVTDNDQAFNILSKC